MSELLKQTKIARKKLETAVEWNFGVVGNCPNANKKLDTLKSLEAKLKDERPAEYETYENEHY